MKADNTVVSMKVGFTYFNVAGTECFKQDHPIVRCLKYSDRGAGPKERFGRGVNDLTGLTDTTHTN
ncbi:UNVERIFIED_CONTAM: hypothetical protein B566_EDAN018892 [Ephemera danica]|nr:hypothetical protein B566_EDAN018892 [Ephemera danica]